MQKNLTLSCYMSKWAAEKMFLLKVKYVFDDYASMISDASEPISS